METGPTSGRIRHFRAGKTPPKPRWTTSAPAAKHSHEDDMENLELRRGDLVEIKSPAEILATLDAKGLCDGLPFMPEMAQFCGKRFTVRARGAAFGRPAHGTFDRLLGFQDPGCSKRGGPVQSPCRRRRHHGVGAGAGAWSASTP